MTTEISVMYGSKNVKQIKIDNSRDQQDEVWGEYMRIRQVGLISGN